MSSSLRNVSTLCTAVLEISILCRDLSANSANAFATFIGWKPHDQALHETILDVVRSFRYQRAAARRETLSSFCLLSVCKSPLLWFLHISRWKDGVIQISRRAHCTVHMVSWYRVGAQTSTTGETHSADDRGESHVNSPTIPLKKSIPEEQAPLPRTLRVNNISITSLVLLCPSCSTFQTYQNGYSSNVLWKLSKRNGGYASDPVGT